MDIYSRLGRLTENCKHCGGKGFVRGAKGERVECSCIAKIEIELKLHRARIPEKYRNFDLRKLTWTFKKENSEQLKSLQKYAAALGVHCEKGSVLWLWSPPGLAKSSMIGWMFNRALELDLCPYYIRADGLTTLRMSRVPEDKEEYSYIMNYTDVVAIEELEKVYLPSNSSYVTQSFYTALAELYDAKKALIITSNSPPKEVLKAFPTYIADRLSEKSYRLAFTGKSGRSNDS